MESIRVLIVDDLEQVREGLVTLLKLSSDRTGTRIVVIGEAKTGSEAVQQARGLHPDVILMDLEMPVMDGYEATRQIKTGQSAVRVVILSIHTGPEEQLRARAAGADAFITKGASYQSLLDAILGRDRSPNSFDLEKGEKL
jgi:DNA-binding NarL/FixJ family response regulator